MLQFQKITGQLALLLIAILAPIHTVSANTLRCNMKHPGGHMERAVVNIDHNAQIVAMHWTYTRKDGSYCNLDPIGSSWAATDKLQLRTGCNLLFWRQNNRITVAPDPETCRTSCSSQSSFDGLLPISFDLRTGQCANH